MKPAELARAKRERSEAEGLVREIYRHAGEHRVAPDWYERAKRVLRRADERKRQR